MKTEILLISTKDIVADEFGPVGMANNELAAIRQFEYQMKKMVESPDIRRDYALYEIGVFNVESGEITISSHHPILLKNGSDYVPADSKVRKSS